MLSEFSVEGKTVFITGASSGIGACCAEVFARGGANVLVSGRDKERLAEVAQKCGANARIFECELNDVEQVSALAENLPAFDGAVFCAGTGFYPPAMLKFASDAELENVMQTNLVSTMRLVRGLIKRRKVNKGGSLVFMSSVAGTFADAGHCLYGVSKAAVAALARELAVELAPRGIRANSLSPAMVKTPMTAAFFADARAAEADSKKYLLGGGDVKSVANAAQFLLSDASAWITGVNLPVDGGYSCWK